LPKVPHSCKANHRICAARADKHWNASSVAAVRPTGSAPEPPAWRARPAGGQTCRGLSCL